MTMAAATMILAACSNDENEGMDNWNGEIRLSSGVTVQQTRTTGIVPDTQIANGQEVGVFINDATLESATYDIGNNLKYTANGSGGLTLADNQDAPYYPATGGSVNIWACQPYNSDASMTGDGFEFTVKTDQNNNSDKDYYDSDLLYSSKEEAYSRQKAAQSLSFKHQLSKVVCTLQSGTGGPTITGATVEIISAETKGTFKPADGSFATATTGGSTSNITMNSSITSGSYIAVIPPQTFAKGAKFLKVTLSEANGGGTFYYTLPNDNGDNDLVLAAHNVYTYTITVNLTGLTVTSSISEWEGIDTNKKNGDAVME